jgi:hypothetical protein
MTDDVVATFDTLLVLLIYFVCQIFPFTTSEIFLQRSKYVMKIINLINAFLYILPLIVVD